MLFVALVGIGADLAAVNDVDFWNRLLDHSGIDALVGITTGVTIGVYIGRRALSAWRP